MPLKEKVFESSVKVVFEIVKKENGKVACDGYFHHTMVHLANGRAAEIPHGLLKSTQSEAK
jgi:acyl-CoA thioesterase FadM